MQVLLRNVECGQQLLGDVVQGREPDALLALARHLAPAEVLGVLLEAGQLGQGVVAHDELGAALDLLVQIRKAE